MMNKTKRCDKEEPLLVERTNLSASEIGMGQALLPEVNIP